jgi:ubiquitin-like-conjugating enzyme ATG3
LETGTSKCFKLDFPGDIAGGVRGDLPEPLFPTDNVSIFSVGTVNLECRLDMKGVDSDWWNLRIRHVVQSNQMSSVKYDTFNFFKGIAEYFTPILKDSQFQEKGVITPEEFVICGDMIVSKCPTWSWATGDEKKIVSWLPKNKQYLVTKNVPCQKRAKDLEIGDSDEKDIGDDWTETHVSHGNKTDEFTETIEKSSKIEQDDDEDIMDIEDYNGENIIEDTDDTSINVRNDLILKTRTYDLSITYDKFYQTPRVFLFGYDEQGKPLEPKQIMEDIYADYSLKTVSMVDHPHLNAQHCSIHPCRHAETMKRMIDRLASDGKYIRVDLYLYLFLKFVSAVIPTIEYDFTIQIDSKSK